MLSERTLSDPAVYMRLRGYSPTVIIECAVRPKQFAANEGVAFPAKNKDGQSYRRRLLLFRVLPERHAHPNPVEGVMAAYRCHFCGGRFGLIRYHSRRLFRRHSFCSKRCRRIWGEHRDRQLDWLRFLGSSKP